MVAPLSMCGGKQCFYAWEKVKFKIFKAYQKDMNQNCKEANVASLD